MDAIFSQRRIGIAGTVSPLQEGRSITIFFFFNYLQQNKSCKSIYSVQNNESLSFEIQNGNYNFRRAPLLQTDTIFPYRVIF